MSEGTVRRRERRRRLPVVAGIILLCVSLSASGCLYTNLVAPLDLDLHQTELGDRVGRSEAHSVLGLFAWGDAGTQAAARAGGIQTIRHADREIFSVLGLVYVRVRTVVYGN